MKRILIAIASAVLVVVLSLIITVPIMNDNFAKKTASDIFSVPLPEKTTYIVEPQKTTIHFRKS